MSNLDYIFRKELGKKLVKIVEGGDFSEEGRVEACKLIKRLPSAVEGLNPEEMVKLYNALYSNRQYDLANSVQRIVELSPLFGKSGFREQILKDMAIVRRMDKYKKANITSDVK